MFRELEGRALTAQEQSIIAQRVALQQAMSQENERRQLARKASGRRPQPGTPRGLQLSGGGFERQSTGAAASRRLARCPAAAACIRPSTDTRFRLCCLAAAPSTRCFPSSQLAEIKSVCPDATDDEALAALEDKQGKCVLCLVAPNQGAGHAKPPRVAWSQAETPESYASPTDASFAVRTRLPRR